MAKYNFKTSLSVDGIDRVIQELQNYQNVTLSNKLNLFIEELAKEGIRVASVNVHSDFVAFVDFVYNSSSLGKGEMVGLSQPIYREWYDKSGNVAGGYDIDPIAMAEFGAGIFADSNPWGISGLRGSLGDNGKRISWCWYDSVGNRLSSDNDTSIVPTRPMYKALVEMMNVYESVARKVFGN